MNRVLLDRDGAPVWPSPDAILLVVTSATRYNEAVMTLTRSIVDGDGGGVFLTANRPVQVLRSQTDEVGVPLGSFYVIDCVSAMTGVMPPSEEGVLYIESPTLLEKMAMRAEQVLRHRGGGTLVVDSLSTLCVYNGVQAVSELVHSLVTRLRLHRMGAALVLVEKQADGTLMEAVAPLCDGVVTL